MSIEARQNGKYLDITVEPSQQTMFQLDRDFSESDAQAAFAIIDDPKLTTNQKIMRLMVIWDDQQMAIASAAEDEGKS